MGELIAFPRPHREGEARPERTRTPPLWREVAGRVLRTVRTGRGETLTQVADRAGVSVPYLSEIERGRKEPSSEVLAAVTTALDLTLLDLSTMMTAALRSTDLTSRGITPGRPSGPIALAV